MQLYTYYSQSVKTVLLLITSILFSVLAFADPLTLNIYRHDGSLKGIQEMDDTNQAMIDHTVNVSSLGYLCVAGVNLNSDHPSDRILSIIASDGALVITNLE